MPPIGRYLLGEFSARLHEERNTAHFKLSSNYSRRCPALPDLSPASEKILDSHLQLPRQSIHTRCLTECATGWVGHCACKRSWVIEQIVSLQAVLEPVPLMN